MLRKQEQNARPPCSDESASDKMFKTIKKERTFFRPFANYEQPQPSSQNQQQQHQHQQHQRQNKSQAEKREDCFGIRCNHWHRERKNFSELVLWAEKHFFISSRHLSEHAQCLRLYEEKMKKRLEQYHGVDARVVWVLPTMNRFTWAKEFGDPRNTLVKLPGASEVYDVSGRRVTVDKLCG